MAMPGISLDFEMNLDMTTALRWKDWMRRLKLRKEEVRRDADYVGGDCLDV
jgi:hypothetical protein